MPHLSLHGADKLLSGMVVTKKRKWVGMKEGELGRKRKRGRVLYTSYTRKKEESVSYVDITHPKNFISRFTQQ